MANCNYPTGIMTLNNAEKLVTYPNPAQNNLSFKFTTIFSSTIAVQLKDVLGKQVAEYTSPVINTIATINVADLPNGLYYFTIANDKNTINGKITILK